MEGFFPYIFVFTGKLPMLSFLVGKSYCILNFMNLSNLVIFLYMIAEQEFVNLVGRWLTCTLLDVLCDCLD